VRVATAFGLVRAIHGVPMEPTSFYRTVSYNAAVGGAKSGLHVEGLAWDQRPPSGVDVRDFARELVALARTPQGAIIRGIGYAGRRHGATWDGVHIDCRATPDLVLWRYTARGIETWTI
jgi:hypothetical protein